MVPIYSSFSFSLDDRACQHLAKLLLLWRREEEEGVGVEVEVRVNERGFHSGAQPFTVRITPFRMLKGVMALLSPLSFHGSSIY